MCQVEPVRKKDSRQAIMTRRCYESLQIASLLLLLSVLLSGPIEILHLASPVCLSEFPSAIENKGIFQQYKHAAADNATTPASLKKPWSTALEN